VHLVGFTIEIYYDARSYKRQKNFWVETLRDDMSWRRMPLRQSPIVGFCEHGTERSKYTKGSKCFD
jgi:hypothetical protein